ncbi:5-oxoprolinase subunit B family protein [Nocardia crassostreae]|uniref:5-oxoprolinase subunit B family protein n=1 Tax=Nocardia crassostreae TaxID=53428 RepID=UPI00082E2C2A|nr:allophanate hydrolase subunit 1 [Nocardia crassostreae]
MSDSGTTPAAGDIRPAGDRALLVIPPLRAMLPDLVEALHPRPAGVVDVLPAAETVLITLTSPAAAEPVRKRLAALLARLDSQARVATGARGLPGWRPSAADYPEETVGGNGFHGEPLVIPVRYDGADLPDVARHLGLTTAEVIAQHTGTEWRCAFVGFAPGFGYLESADGRLTVPRRTQSRTAIPAGAVALAGGYSAVYPRSSPGGWQLIGTTELAMWDVERDPPALVRAGTRVRFVDAGTSGVTS